MTPFLSVENLSAGYRGRTVLHNLCFHIPPGITTALIGPNGAGKSTLLRCLAGRMLPLTGRVMLDQKIISRLPDRERARRLGVVPQQCELPVAFSVEEVVALGRGSRTEGWSRSDPGGQEAVERAMALTDVIDLRRRDARTLSGGERQRTILAMVLAQEPDILLLDEATAHLDVNHRREVMQIVERLNRETGMTLLLVSHDLDLAAACCERVLLLKQGRLIADGTTGEVLTPALLSEAYGCDVAVQRLAGGELHVSPAMRSCELAHRGDQLPVHVIGGGGSAEPLMRQLRLAGYSLSAGVLNRQDSDADVARALGIPCALEKPFAPIGDEALQEASEMVRQACAVVLAPAPFGPGNLRNLDLADLARRLGKTVLLADGIIERDFSPGRQATSRGKQLVASGATPYKGLRDIPRLLPHREAPGPSLKQAFNFSLGATSYVIPAPILPNLRALAGRVDDVQLLMFESEDYSSLPTPDEVAAIASQAGQAGLSLSVHLPMDVRLADTNRQSRQHGVDLVAKVYQRLAPLAPQAWVLHLVPPPVGGGDGGGLAEAAESLAALAARGLPMDKLAVENLDYDFPELVPLLEQAGAGICMDLGHLLLRRENPLDFFHRYRRLIRCLHLHGLSRGRDHADLTCLPDGLLASLVKEVAGQPEAGNTIMTVEVFSEAGLNRSLEVLQKLAVPGMPRPGLNS